MSTIRLGNIPIGIKLGTGFAVVVLFAGLIIVLGLNSMSDYHSRSVIVGEVSSAESLLLDARVEEKNYQIRQQDEYLQHAKTLADDAVETLLPLKDLLVVPADDARVDRIAEGVERYKALLDELQASTESGNTDTGTIMQDLVSVARESVDTAVELQEVQLGRMAEDYDTLFTTFMSVGALTVLLSVAIAWWLVRAVTHPIQQAVAVANRVAASDLTVQVHTDRGDEFGQLLAAFATMVSNLRELIRQIDGDAAKISLSSDELARVTQQTSQGVQQQSDGTDQVATAMNQMVATVNNVAESAEAAFEAARRANDNASEGEQAVENTIAAVSRLDNQNNDVMEQLRSLQKDTENIGSILEVIKSVADQTNLLALNAAIEAARAGEHGRGFAVVADEVRSLARRTQDSTTEIESLIGNLVTSADNSVQKMTSGTELSQQTLDTARRAGEVIRVMAASVEEIRQYNSQIATAAEEQSSTAEDINQNVTRIREIAEQSAASTGQVSSSSEELARLAEGLSVQVNRFRL